MPKDKKELFFKTSMSDADIVPNNNNDQSNTSDNSRQTSMSGPSDIASAGGFGADKTDDRGPGVGGTPPKTAGGVSDIYISKSIPLPPTDHKKNNTSNKDKVILKDNTLDNNKVLLKKKRRKISLSERIDNAIPKKEKFATHVSQTKYIKKPAKQKLPLDIKKVFKPEYKHLSSVLLPGNNTKKIRKTFALTIKYDGDVKRAMREAGYSPVTVNKGSNSIIKSKSWEKLIEYYFPTVMLFEKEHELLNHPDWRATNSSLDRIHKLKGNFINKVEHSLKPGEDLKEKTDIELRRIIDATSDEDDSILESPSSSEVDV